MKYRHLVIDDRGSSVLYERDHPDEPWRLVDEQRIGQPRLRRQTAPEPPRSRARKKRR